jgi:hypothetical protein
VGVFGHHDRGFLARGKGIQDGAEKPIPPIGVDWKMLRLNAERGSEIANRTQGTGRGEAVTRGAQHSDLIRDAAAELFDHRGLANPRFTGEENNASATSAHLSQVIRKTREGGFALE